MKYPLLLGLAAVAVAAAIFPAEARDRYAERPPVVVSPDLAAPWVMQLRRKPVTTLGWQSRAKRPPVQTYPRVRRQAWPDQVQTAAVPPQPQMYTKKEMKRRLDPKFLPRQVAYDGPEKPGTIVIDSGEKFLYLVLPGGKARRYGVGVGKEGFGWSGTEKITRKAAWPDWHPPAEMIVREREMGRILPVRMEGGVANPLGARALYLGSTLYRIHGTNAPWTIGTNVSSGCIRLRNEDVVDLYERVDVGTKVVVM
jgi:lipoprotein-anchoring transpeptidase ErfK/SrfK